MIDVQLGGQTVNVQVYNTTLGGVRSLVAADLAVDVNARAAKAQNGADFADKEEVTQNLLFLQSGTGTVARSVRAKLRETVHARDFGAAAGGGSGDDSAVLQAAFNSGASCVHLGDGLTFRITSPVTVPDNINVDFGTSRILYAGPRPGTVAVRFGSDAAAGNSARYRNVWVESETLDVSSAGYVGAQFVNVQRTHIKVHKVAGFTHSVEFYSNGQGVTGVHFTASFIGDSKYAITTTCNGDVFNYINGNHLFVEDWTNVVAPNGDTYGWYARGTGVDPENQNGNTVYFQTAQPGNGTSGDVRALVLLDNTGSLNTIRCDRYESGRGNIVVINGPVGDGVTASPLVAGNTVELGLVTNGGGSITQTISQNGSARGNVLRWLNDITAYPDEDRVDDLVKKIKAYSAGNITATGGIHLTIGDGEPALYTANTINEIETDRDCVRNNGNRSIGRFIDCEGGDTFVMWAKTLGGSKCLLGVAPYDANGNRLGAGGSMPGTVYVRSDPAVVTYNRWTSDMGGCYRTGSGVDSWVFTVHPDVRRLRYFIQGGRAQAFGIRRLTHNAVPLVGFSGLENNGAHYVSGAPDPTVGIYGRGDVAYLDNASGAGLDAYQWTLGGRGAPAWVASTAYSLGQLRANGGNVYEVTTAGTSAGSGGPTGTGSGIADGTVVWRYVTTLAVATAV